MPKIQQSEIRKKDFYTVRDIRNNDVKRMMVPNGLQLGVDGFTPDAVPLRFVSGALKNSPEPGGVEYDGTDIFYTTDGLSRRNITAKPYGSYLDTSTTAASPGNESIFSFDTTTYSSYVDLVGSTKIYPGYTGMYNIMFSVQFENSSTANEYDAYVWLKVDGTNVANSRSDVTIHKKHTGINGSAILAVNLFQMMASGSYFELAWTATNAAVTATTATAGVSPTTPAAPAVILTVNRID